MIPEYNSIEFRSDCKICLVRDEENQDHIEFVTFHDLYLDLPILSKIQTVKCKFKLGMQIFFGIIA